MSSPQPTAAVSGSGYYKYADTSVQGVWIWILIAVAVSLISLLLYEFLRRQPFMARILYTRSLAMSSECPPFPKGWFEWIPLAFATKEATILSQVGLDAVLFLRFLWICFAF